MSDMSIPILPGIRSKDGGALVPKQIVYTGSYSLKWFGFPFAPLKSEVGSPFVHGVAPGRIAVYFLAYKESGPRLLRLMALFASPDRRSLVEIPCLHCPEYVPR